MSSLLRSYNTLLLRRPLVTSCCTAAVLFGAGDVLAQQGIESKGKNHDFVRTARLAFFGGAIFGPCMSKWYQFLNSIKFTSPIRATIVRVGLDQAVLTPVAVPFFFGSMSVLEGNPHQAVERIKSAYIPTLIRNWSVFIPTQIINFSFVPHHLRFVVVGVVSLFWNTYLSTVNAREQGLEMEQEAREEKAV